jgi:hypothetical protein
MTDETDFAGVPEFLSARHDRRSVMSGSAKVATAAAAASIFPQEVFGMSQDETAAFQSEFVFEAAIKRGDPMNVGPSKYGSRRVVDLLGGSFQGPNIKGEIPSGGTSVYVDRPDGCTEVNAQYVLKTDDGAIIYTLNEGLIVPMGDGKPPYIRMTASFEAPIGKYDWLNKALYLGLAHPNPVAQTSNLRIYKIL